MLIYISESTSWGKPLQNCLISILRNNCIHCEKLSFLGHLEPQHPRLANWGLQEWEANVLWADLFLSECMCSDMKVTSHNCLLVQSTYHILQFCPTISPGIATNLAGTITKLSVILSLIFLRPAASGHRIKPLTLFGIMLGSRTFLYTKIHIKKYSPQIGRWFEYTQLIVDILLWWL